MKVYVLTALLITYGAPKNKVNFETHVFEDESRCLKNVAANQARLEEVYDQVHMYCTESKVMPKEPRR